MAGQEPIQDRLRKLFASQSLAVLSTAGPEGPYGSLVAFTPTPDLRELLFVTPRATRKVANLENERRAAMLIDNRSNREADFHEAMAATAVGVVEEVPAADRSALAELYLAKHPHLSEFLASPGCAFFRLVVGKYHVVSRFQNVVVWDLRDEAHPSA